MKTVIRFMQTLLLTAAFCFPAEASASDTDNIMVREDRVWQQNLYLGDVWDEWFDGTTAIGGKNYHISARPKTAKFRNSSSHICAKKAARSI